MKIYTIYDRVAIRYFNPILFRNDAQAKRSFNALCTDPQSELHLAPSDYDLVGIGSFDEDKGSITPCDPYTVSNGADAPAPFREV